jgi:hypothetical protein
MCVSIYSILNVVFKINVFIFKIKCITNENIPYDYFKYMRTF